MVKVNRKKMVLAMEMLARSVNSEDAFESWLMCGVADGDIPLRSLDVDDVDDYYTEDEPYKDLMTTFLRVMVNAWEDGGLYDDGIVSDDKNSEE